MATKQLIVIFYTLLIYFCALIKCNSVDIDEINRQLDGFLVDFDGSKFSSAVEINDELFPFNNYEFENGNREELIVKNVSSRIDPLLLDVMNNLEFISNGRNFYLAGSIHSVIFINVMDNKKSRIVDQYQITSRERIQTFKAFFPFNKTPNNAPLILVVAIDVIYGSELRWYTFNGNKLEQFWLWPVDSQIEKLEYFQHDRENRLIILKNAPNSNQFQIDIYGFAITENSSESWYLQGLQTTEITDIKLCPTYDGTMILLQIREYIFVYNYYSVTSKKEHLELVQEIKLTDLKNFICFHSGNIQYLVTAGSNSSIFEYFNGKFQVDLASTDILKSAGEIYWIQSLPLDTYRKEVLLLAQLENLSIFFLSWQARGFELILQPFFPPHPIDLSKIIVIPEMGFIYENKIVRIETQLIEVLSPNYEEIKKFVGTLNKLMEIFQKQEFIVEETERRITEKYLKHSIVNGMWNISELKIVADDDTKVNENIECKSVWINAMNSSCRDFNSSYNEITSSLERINLILNEINSNMKNAIAINTTDFSSFNNIEIVGDFKVRGTISLQNLTFNAVNNIFVNDIDKYLNSYNGAIEGEKFFPSIVVEKLSLHSVNGIPMNQMILDAELINYEGINFSDIKELEAEGDLYFSHINNINWQSLMKSTIRKSKEAIIPEELIVRGTINAEYANVEYLNNLKYPSEYVQKKSRGSVLMNGAKKFKKLYVDKLGSVSTINKIPISDFILLNGDTTLDEEITFHDLTVNGFLEINGEIRDHKRQLIKRQATNKIDADIFFKRVRVHGNIQVIENINNKTWSDFDDLLIKGDDLVEIIGKKTFLGRVEIGPGLEIISNKINGHLINEFMTLDTYQELSNLKRIDAGIKIERLIESDVIQLERLLFENKFHGSHMCLNKHFVFKVPPIVNKISADVINGRIPNYIFASKLNESFHNVVVENMNVKNLQVNTMKPQMINGLNYTKLLMGNFQHGKKNDKELQEDLNKLENHLDNLYEKIANGSVAIRNLNVTGSIKTKILNGILLSNIYNVSNMGSVIFEQNVHIEDLTMHGLINSMNFSEFVPDAILKTDKNVVITGKKKLDKIICESLDFSAWNNRSIDDVLDPSKHQILTGKIIVKGEIIVEEYFDPAGKIGGIYFQDIVKNINYLGNNTYIVNGNFQFTTNDTIDINNLTVTDNIQDVNFNDFIESVVFLDSENVSLTGEKTFRNSVSLNNLTITKMFDNIDLETYFRDVIRIDKPVSLESEVIFEDEIRIGGDLMIKKNLMARTIMEIDFEELLATAMYINEATIVPGTIKFNNLKIQSDIQIKKINNIDMSKLLTLYQDQIIPASLYCDHITVGKLNIVGQLNGYDLSAIYDSTFLLTGDQNVTGKISFLGEVTVEDFDSKLINNFDPNKLISTDKDEIIVGNFTFNSPVILNGNLNVDGKFNNADLLEWKKAVMLNGTLSNTQDNKQIISGDWIIRGNVHFRGGIYGNDYLNNINVKKLNAGLSARKLNITKGIRDKRHNIQKICRDLKFLKKTIDQRIYKYKYFEYFQIINFDEIIVSIHHLEYNNSDYLFVNFQNCRLDFLVLNNNDMKFNRVNGIDNFGYINRWISFKFLESFYILTLGEPVCNRSSGNVWKLSNDKLILIMDLGNATDAKKIDNNNFFIIINGTINYYSLEDITKNSTVSINSWKFANKNIKFLPHTDELFLMDDNSLYELKKNKTKFSVSENVFKTIRVTSFRMGIFQRELFIYYDKKISDNYIFISHYNLSSHHIVQTITVNRPVSIRMINFDNFVENFLIFIENRNKIQIYNYKGIEGFVYRETIQMKAEKLYTLKLRIYPNIVKKNCLAVLNKNRLIILEAKMYGEKFDFDHYLCTNNS